MKIELEDLYTNGDRPYGLPPEPSAYEYGKALSDARKNWDITYYKSIPGSDLPYLIDELEADGEIGDFIDVSLGDLKSVTYRKVDGGYKRSVSGQFSEDFLTADQAKHWIESSSKSKWAEIWRKK